jgi:cytochrome c biogenesis protein CcmG, thiol:disulfide interchange protein DsbE
MQRRLVRIAIVAGLSVLATSLAIGLQTRGRPAAEARAVDLPLGAQVNRRVPPVRVLDAAGKPTSLAALRGRWVALAPVSTFCHETCPLTTAALLRLRRTMRAAGAGSRFAIAEVSVDPWRDSPARLRAYRRETDARLPVFTGGLAPLRRFWRFLGVGFHRTPADVAHTDAVFLIDPSGRERVAIAGAPGTWTPHGVAADLRLLMGLRVQLRGSAPTSRAAGHPPVDPPPPLIALHAQAGRLLDGEGLEGRLRSLRGYPIVLNAWASWCPPCREELPLFASAAARYGNRVAFLGADVEDDAGDARGLLAEIPVAYPSYSTSLADLHFLASTPGTPFTVFIDPKGKVTNVHIGAYRSEDELDTDVEALLDS